MYIIEEILNFERLNSLNLYVCVLLPIDVSLLKFRDKLINVVQKIYLEIWRVVSELEMPFIYPCTKTDKEINLSH